MTMRPPRGAEPPLDADLVIAARQGDGAAFATLFERWFDRSYAVAFRILHDRDAAADVAQDTFVSAWRSIDSLRDPQAFGGWLLRTSRNTALTRLERDRRTSTIGDEEVIGLVDARRPGDDATAALEATEQHDLVWAASAALGERDASVLGLHLRHGLEPGEIGEALGITANNAHQVLFRLRNRLGAAVRAWVLWHDGRPRCDQLATVLTAAGITSFGAPAVRTIAAHADDCPDCTERRGAVLAPEALFAAVPVAAAPAGVREQVATALGRAGLPVDVPTAPTPTGPNAGPPAGPPAGPDAGPDAGPPADTAGPPPPRGTGRRAVAAVVAVVALVVVAIVVATAGDDERTEAAPPATDDDSPATSARAGSPSTTRPPGTALAQATTTTTTDGPTTSSTPVPVEPGTTAPPLAPGGDPADTSPPPPTDTTSGSDPEPPPPPPPAPTVTAFTATQTGVGPCGVSSGRTYELTWSTTGAEAVTIEGPGAEPGPHPPTGSTTACGPFGPPLTWAITASGPGGDVVSTTSG